MLCLSEQYEGCMLKHPYVQHRVRDRLRDQVKSKEQTSLRFVVILSNIPKEVQSLTEELVGVRHR